MKYLITTWSILWLTWCMFTCNINAQQSNTTVTPATNTIRKSVNQKYPDNASEYNGHHYLVFENHMSWKEAKKACENNGGHLVTMTDDNESEFIDSIANKRNSYWIGLTSEGWQNRKFNQKPRNFKSTSHVHMRQSVDVTKKKVQMNGFSTDTSIGSVTREETDFKWIDNVKLKKGTWRGTNDSFPARRTEISKKTLGTDDIVDDYVVLHNASWYVRENMSSKNDGYICEWDN